MSIIFACLYLLQLVIVFVGVKDSIKDMEDRAIVPHILFMMKVMIGSSCTEGKQLWLSPRPIITRMAVACLKQSESEPNYDSKDMDRINFRK